jgi:hypothetical protein
MDGTGFNQHSPCDTDMLFIKGFKYWQPPVRCGNLTGFSSLIDHSQNISEGMKSIKLLAVMSSFHYKWKIKIRLIKSKTTPTKVRDDKDEIESSTGMRVK